jgi:cbb3-type cytochrome oxidase subunit 1
VETFVRNFIRSSLIWFGTGVLLGLGMAWWPAQHLAYRPAHMHANLLGFVSMMIFGVAYHVIPRFAGSPLRSRTLARAHLWIANLGLAGMVGGWILRVWVRTPGTVLLRTGAGLSAVGAFLFIYNIWRTLGSGRVGIARGASPVAHARPGAAPAGAGGTGPGSRTVPMGGASPSPDGGR